MFAFRNVVNFVVITIVVGLNAALFIGCASRPSQTAVATPLSRAEEAERLFEVLDVDGNGKISREEARSGFKYLIASYDRGNENEILAAKPGSTSEVPQKRKPKRRPTSQDATKAFEALFEKPGATANEISRDAFNKMVLKSSDNPETDPVVAFY
jgi:hypothetical protein